ncbi:MAG: hypothetical protein E5Y51_05575 [Mesorhizobium sp.]|uniref:hypothetical protein n=1 Tax=Mesorhizobium sp. M1A.F.Ca.IN.022.06.1.1 TaxID=2493680 RepID=UPI00121C442D|nr:hypothetical protein [Mesorhizobium sp. M1A.F.Ca.IN.022.06.1.1]TIN19672.1 MAG: hypothetical protein E5Y51_05575 [Mesorhizobium sp.]
MDGYTFATKMVESLVQLVAALAWPTAVVALAFVFKGRLGDLLHRIREVTGPAGTSAKFAEKLEEAREASEASPDDQPRPQITADDPYLDLAKQFPGAAVMRAYQDVEEFIREHLRTRSVANPEAPSNHLNYVRRLAKEGSIPASLMDIYNRLRDTRNAAVHTRAEVSPLEALEYRELSQRFIVSLREALEKSKA